MRGGGGGERYRENKVTAMLSTGKFLGGRRSLDVLCFLGVCWHFVGVPTLLGNGRVGNGDGMEWLYEKRPSRTVSGGVLLDDTQIEALLFRRMSKGSQGPPQSPPTGNSNIFGASEYNSSFDMMVGVPDVGDATPNTDSSLPPSETPTKKYTNPILPEDPPNGTVPEGHTAQRSGSAAICFDGTGYFPKGDTHSSATAHTINGQYLNGDETKYVVVNRQDWEGKGQKFPLGSKVYAYNRNTGMGTWAIVGDRGPTQSRAEMSVATARALGVDIATNSNGNMKDACDEDSIDYFFYN